MPSFSSATPMLFLSDEFPEQGGMGPVASSPVTIHLYVTDVDAAFGRAVEAGAKVVMPLADMFWGDRYGRLVDPFGHHWSIAEHLEDLTPEQMKERLVAAMSASARSHSPKASRNRERQRNCRDQRRRRTDPLGGSFSPGTVINPSFTQAVSAPCADNGGGLSGIALRFPWTGKLNRERATRRRR